MLNKNKFSAYVKHYKEKMGIASGELAKKLGVSAPFMTAIENKNKHFADNKLEKFAEVFDLNEIEFAEILLQRTIDQYSEKRGTKTLQNIKKMLPLYKKVIDGEIKGIELPESKDSDPIIEIKKNIAKIPNKRVREFLMADINYALQRFTD
jgi:transcriptional regulator with XRE-family HTH domain